MQRLEVSGAVWVVRGQTDSRTFAVSFHTATYTCRRMLAVVAQGGINFARPIHSVNEEPSLFRHVELAF